MIYPILLLILVLGSVFLYNRFIRLDNMSREAWSDVNVQLKRRYALIPNLVTTIKGYMKYEKNTINDIIQTRSTALRQNAPAEKADSENRLTQGLKHIFAVAEQYPVLKTNKQFQELFKNLVEIENTLQTARRYYNATVRDYNIAIHSFPGNLLACLLHLKDKPYFEIAAFETKNIKVKFHEK